MPALSKDELLAALRAHTDEMATLKKRRDKLTTARRAIMRRLHQDHGMSMRDLGDVAGMSGAAVLRNLREAEATADAESKAAAGS